MIKFIHTADIHFGVENYGRLDVKTGIHSRLLDFKKALDFCIEFAIESKVDFFLFAGDAYKTPTPTPTHQKLLAHSLLKLYNSGIPIIMIVGNHDNPLSFGKANALEIFGQFPVKGFYIISKPEIIFLNTKNGPIQIVGIPWPTRNNISINNEHININQQDITKYISKAVCNIIKDFANKLNPNIPAILSGHLTVSTGIFSGSEKQAIYGSDPIFMPSEIAIKPFDYIALGHLHRFQDLGNSTGPSIVYSGSIERVDFGERNEDKGFCLVNIKSKEDVNYKFIKTPVRKFLQIEIYLNDDYNQTDQILDKLSKYNIEGAVIKLIYYLKNNQKDRVDLSKIQQYCSKAWYIVGVFPKLSLSRERRNVLNTDMSFKKLLEIYFENKLEYKSKKDKLIQKALLLESEFNNAN